MSETRPTMNVRIPKALIEQMRADGFTENFGHYLEEIYRQKPREYIYGETRDK